MDQKRNEFMRERRDIQEIVGWERKRHREYIDHVDRMSNERLADIASTEKDHVNSQELFRD